MGSSFFAYLLIEKPAEASQKEAVKAALAKAK